MPGALLTDLYELNMVASYLRRGMTSPATFSLYVRTLSPHRGFLVTAGLESCLGFLEDLSFGDEDLGYLASIAAARDSAIVGFVSTSNVEAARRYGLRAAGTMAHSFIEAFESEVGAFRAFAEDHPDSTTFLVDTYETPNGVRNAIETIRELGITGGV